MVLMTPITGINSRPESKTKNMTLKPISEQGLQKMKEWLETESWAEITGEPCANEKNAGKFQFLISHFLLTNYLI